MYIQEAGNMKQSVKILHDKQYRLNEQIGKFSPFAPSGRTWGSVSTPVYGCTLKSTRFSDIMPVLNLFAKVGVSKSEVDEIEGLHK